MSGPDVCEHGNRGDQPCAECATEVGPMGALEIIGWVSDALQQQELEDDSTGYLERLIQALRRRGVGSPEQGQP